MVDIDSDTLISFLFKWNKQTKQTKKALKNQISP